MFSFSSGVNFMKRYLLCLVCLSLLYGQKVFLCVCMVICVCVCVCVYVCVHSYPYCPGCQSTSCIFTFLVSSTK